MKITNFKLIKTIKNPKIGDGLVVQYTKIAEVDVTTGKWFWKKTERKQVACKNTLWFFLDTGMFVPDSTVERLYEAYEIKKLLNE